MLFATVDPERWVAVHLTAYPSKSYLTTRLFFAEFEQLYSELPRTVIIEGIREYGATIRRVCIRQVVIPH
ncbi:hypothetical protein [Natronorarus salvus]|uniref:hypothetical protein n=1 Tax=Natronorarus salvus TaxID=3117733 RepID=UPI002F26187F